VQLSFGLQAGGQAYSQVTFFKDKRSLDEFTSGNFEFGADASAIAMTAGANATAGAAGTGASNTSQSNAKAGLHYNKGMAVLTLAGQTYSFKKPERSRWALARRACENNRAPTLVGWTL
jgi:lipid-binding SYLF domain-containing protein